jgi:alkanesulfonate monooxygenase SsuD/methylene tetrahydromethanopterin reductase-like flavin-dependent oxidoreductase (luciferase family)
MKFGIFPTEGGRTWDGVIDEVQLAEDLGYESCWVNDHQVTEGDNYWPSPLTRLTSVGTATDLELVTSVLILPLYHPLHVAQRAAMLDVISDGNLTLGVGLGYVEKEFEAFDVPMGERAGRLIEGVKFLKEFFEADEPFSFDSPFFSVEDWEAMPRTVQEPRPPVWIGGWGDKQLSRSVKFGDAWVPGVVADLTEIAERKDKQAAMLESEGRELGDVEHPLMREAVIAETHEEAVELGKKHLHATYVDEYGGGFSHPLLDADDVADFERLAEERFLVGTPNEVIEQIETMRERIPLDHLSVRFHHTGMDHDTVMDQIELFGEEVVPAFD